MVECGGMFWAPMWAEVRWSHSFFIAMETEMLGMSAGLASQSHRRDQSALCRPAHQLYFFISKNYCPKEDCANVGVHGVIL